MLAVAVAWLLGGCAGPHLYDKGKDELATGIKQQYAQLDLTKAIATEQANLDKLLVYEIQTADDLADIVRDRALWEVMLHPDKTLAELVGFQFGANAASQNYATRRAAQLGVTDQAGVKNALKLVEIFAPPTGRDQAADAAREVLLQRELLEGLFLWPGGNVPGCARAVDLNPLEIGRMANAGTPDEEEDFTTQLELYQGACRTALGLTGSALTGVFGDNPGQVGGKLRDAYLQWQKDIALLEEIDDGRMAIAKELADTRKALEPAEPPPDVVAVIQARAGQAESVLGQLAGHKQLGGDEKLTRRRVDDLALLLKAVHAGQVDDATTAAVAGDPDLAPAVVIAAGIPALGQDVQSLIGQLEGPRARTDLLIERGYQSAKLAYLEKRIGLIEQRAALRRELLSALAREFYFLNTADTAIAAGRVGDCTLSNALDGKAGCKDRYRTNRALIAYGESIGTAQGQAREINARLMDSYHRDGLIVDQYAIGTWNVLLQGPIDQLAAYYEAGIKPESVAELVGGLAALGFLGAIAVGVN
jgi:hypothetical protein